MEEPPENPFKIPPKVVPYPGAVAMMGEERLRSRRRFLEVGVAATVAVVTGVVIWKIQEIMNGENESNTREIAMMYRDPAMTEPVIVPTRKRYPYSESALLIHANEEKKMFLDHAENVDTMIVIADNIANRVAQRVHEGVRASSVHASLRRIGASNESLQRYCALVAAELRRGHCFCFPEGSLHDAVGAGRNVDPFIMFHLDCDLLCDVALHCAARHDIPLHAVAAPNHMYIGSPDYSDFAVEMTAFRGQLDALEVFRGNVLADRVHPDFFSSHAKQRKKWKFDNPNVERTFGFFQPVPEERLHEIAIVELFREVRERVTNGPEGEAFCAEAESKLARYSDGVLLPSVVYYAHVMTREFHIDLGESERARSHDDRIHQMEQQFHGRLHGVLNCNGHVQRLWWMRKER